MRRSNGRGIMIHVPVGTFDINQAKLILELDEKQAKLILELDEKQACNLTLNEIIDLKVAASMLAAVIIEASEYEQVG